MKQDIKRNRIIQLAKTQGLNLQTVELYYEALPDTLRKRLSAKRIIEKYLAHRMASPEYKIAATKFLSAVGILTSAPDQRQISMLG